MKWRTLLTAASLSSLLLSACGTNNDIGDGNTALQSPDNYEQRSIRYNTNDSIGLNTNPYDTVQNENNPKMTKNQERRNLANQNMNDYANNKLSKDVEKKISDLVKSENRNIDDVYVSVNPDFYNRTNSYANDIRDGRPIEGFFDEFNTLVRRVFPTNR